MEAGARNRSLQQPPTPKNKHPPRKERTCGFWCALRRVLMARAAGADDGPASISSSLSLSGSRTAAAAPRIAAADEGEVGEKRGERDAGFPACVCCCVCVLLPRWVLRVSFAIGAGEGGFCLV